jgi:predicted nucleic acid-binding Zn ribbon protein
MPSYKNVVRRKFHSTCDLCHKEFNYIGYKHRHLCDDCQKKPGRKLGSNKETTKLECACSKCGVIFHRVGKYKTTLCDTCRKRPVKNKLQENIKCVICGKIFNQIYRKQVYCSQECRKELEKRKNREYLKDYYDRVLRKKRGWTKRDKQQVEK